MGILRLTQTNLFPGNCWQTAVACILGVPAETLPDQVEIESARSETGHGYHNVLNAYLDVHHGLMYSELFDYQWGALDVRKPGYHLMIGPTTRTAQTGCHHSVVAQHGETIWDPHPSRAGLESVKYWGILAPLPDWLATERAQKRSLFPDRYGCRCPACR